MTKLMEKGIEVMFSPYPCPTWTLDWDTFPAAVTTDPYLHWRFLDTFGQVWVSLLWGHCSSLLGPGEHKVLFVPTKRLVPSPV